MSNSDNNKNSLQPSNSRPESGTTNDSGSSGGKPNTSDTLSVVTETTTESHEFTAEPTGSYAAPEWLPLDGDEEVLWRGGPCWPSVLTSVRFLVGMSVLALILVVFAGLDMTSTLTLSTPAIHADFLAWQLDFAAIATTIPVMWLGIGLAVVAGGFFVSALQRPLFSEYVVTDSAIYLNTSIRSHDYTKADLDRVCDIHVIHHLLGRVLSYGDVALNLTGTTIGTVTLHGLDTPHVVSQMLYDLDVDSDSPVDLCREYVQVSPARDSPDPYEVVEEFGSLHSVIAPSTSLRDRLFSAGAKQRLPITSIKYSQGENQPVEFYFYAKDHLNEVEQRLRKACPNSFDVHRVKCDLGELLVRPRVYSPSEFKSALDAGAVQCRPEEVAALHASTGVGYGESQSGSQSQAQSHSQSRPQSGGESPQPHADGGTTTGTTTGTTGTATRTGTRAGSETEAGSRTPSSHGIDPTAGSLILSLPEVDLDNDIDLDAALFRGDGELSSSERVDLQEIETPAMTPEGNILARPVAEETSPVGIEWTESGDRMMPLEPYSEVVTSRDDRAPAAHPLSTVIDELATAEHPSALFVAAEAEDDWSSAAEKRQDHLRQGNDRSRANSVLRIFQVVLLGLIESLLWIIEGIFDAAFGRDEKQDVPPEQEDHQRRARNQRETHTGDETEVNADTEKIDKITRKQPYRTYLMDVAFVSVPSTNDDAQSDPTTTASRLDKRLRTLTSVFDRVSNDDYQVSGSRIRSGYRKSTKTKRARGVLSRVLDHRLRDSSAGSWIPTRGKGHIRVNGEGLANFFSVPGANALTATGVRGTRSEQDSRKSLSPPHSKHLERFHATRGLDIGYIVDDDGSSDSEVASLSPEVLTSHVARLVSTGGGKTVALINDGLSLYENTDGPVIIVDTRGGNLATNYMRCHAATFGVEDFEENVLHFQIPDIMPGFSFFDIEPAIDDGRSRTDAIADNADNYQEIIKLAMGDKYGNATVAPKVIESLIKTLYDEEHGYENGRYRESQDYYAHDQLEYVVDRLMQAGPPDPDPTKMPQSSKRNVNRVLRRQLERDTRSFQTVMGGVGTRTHYISGDDRLQPMFNNTDSKFEFREMLDDNKVILLDLSALRKASAQVVAGVLLTQLSDAVHDNQDKIAGKPSDYLVNLLVDEAASVMSSQTMNSMLEEGRKFRLSLDLATQFPEQFKYEANQQAYLNVLNNVATPIVGQINVDEKIADALAYEEMDIDEVKDRLKALPLGELMVRTRTKGWGENHPTPFSLRPMGIPKGYPDSEQQLTDASEQRFQEALAEVDARTQSEYGVEKDHAPPDYVTPGELRGYLGIEDVGFDVVIAETVRTVQLHDEVAESNDRVALETVEAELTKLFGAVGGLTVEEDGPSAETLAEIERRSHLLDLEIADGIDLDSWPENYGPSVSEAYEKEIAKPNRGSDQAMTIKLTDAGLEQTSLDLGHVEAAGGEEHIGMLGQVEQVLSEVGFSVQLVPQDGRDLPDARAFHPDLDETYHIEAEHTTPDVPLKVLENLWKAQDAGCTPIFVVETDVDVPAYWGQRVEHILSPPVKHAYDDGRVEYYTYSSEEVELAGDTTAVRPTSGDNDSRYTVWTKTADGEYVLRDGSRDEHCRLTDWDDLSKQDFPGAKWYDPDSNQHVVFANGIEYTYASEEELDEDWVSVKKPYLPDAELPMPEYDHDDYRIVMLPLPEEKRPDGEQSGDVEFEDEPVVYREGEMYSLSALVDGISDEEGDQQPDSNMNQTQDSPDTDDSSTQSSSTPDSSADSDLSDTSADPYESFFDICTTDNPDEIANEDWIEGGGDPCVPKDVLLDSLNIWLDRHDDSDSSTVTKTALTQTILPQYIGEDKFDSSRPKINGKQTSSYIGLSLTERGKEHVSDT
jgi:hypothetical protein